MKLYEWTDAYKRVQGLLEEEGEDWRPALEAIGGEFDDKVENTAKLIQTLKAEAGVFKAERERCSAREEALSNRAESLKEYLLKEMQAVGKDKVKGSLLTVSLRTSPPSCEVVDSALIPEEYLRHIPEQWVVDRKPIIDHWKKTGEVPAGVTIVADKQTVQIR